MSDISYQKQHGEFVLVHRLDLRGCNALQERILYAGKEVAIGFTYDPESDDGIQFTAHRHGSPASVQDWVEKQKHGLQRARFQRTPLGLWAHPHSISSDAWEVDDLNLIINTTGYLGTALKNLGINLISLTA